VQTALVGPVPRIAVSYDGRGPLLLFLHGIRGNKRNWFAQLAAFSSRFTAAAWDARGYGESDDYEAPLEFADFSADVARVADHFGAQKLHLVGLSMGGRIARNVALRFPERLHSVTLVATAPEFKRGRTPLPMEKLVGSRARPDAMDELRDSFARVRKASYEKTLEASQAQDHGAPIEAIRTPTLVIAGDEDQMYPPDTAREMARRIPDAELAMIEGAGHLPNLEQPERFNQILADFLKRRFP
jgi:pimeloyl-ACP methyl ester carboxylesterase